MFVDQVKILVKGGDGGNGCVSFRREAHVPARRPGRRRRGQGRRRRARRGLPPEHPAPAALPRRVPRRARRPRRPRQPHRPRTAPSDSWSACRPAPSARDEATGEPLGEVLRDGDRLVVARGGPRRPRQPLVPLEPQPRAARGRARAQPGEERWLRLDLRLIADVGLLGLPNAGKSTLLVAPLRRAAQGRRLPVHHPHPGARGGRGGRADLRGRRHPRHHRGRRTRAPASACSSCATSSARACCCTSSTPRA